MDKFCLNCGTKLNNDEKFCQNCGAKVDDSSNIESNVENVESNIQNNIEQTNTINSNNQYNSQSYVIEKTSGFAVASLVCSLVGLVLFRTTMGILAICFSITAKKRMKTFTNEKGEGMATAGFIVGIVDIVISFSLFIILMMALLY